MYEILSATDRARAVLVELWSAYENLAHAYLTRDQEWVQREMRMIGRLRDAMSGLGEVDLALNEEVEILAAEWEVRLAAIERGMLFDDNAAIERDTLHGDLPESRAESDAEGGLPPDVMSDYERAIRYLRNGTRDLRDKAQASDTVRSALALTLVDGLERSLRAVKQHLATTYDIDADLFVELIAPSPDLPAPPPGYRVLASTRSVGTQIVPWSSSPHLLRLFFVQGSVDAPETDWAVVGDRNEVRGDTLYRGGVSLVLHHGLIPAAADDGLSYDIAGFISMLTAERLAPTTAASVIHTLRAYAYGVGSLLNTYELATTLVHQRESSGLRSMVNRVLKIGSFGWRGR